MEQATFYITGGYLEIEKSIFVKELLKSQSFLKSIIKPQNLGPKGKLPLIIKSDPSTVVIEYNNVSDIKLSDHYDTEIRKVKKQFKGDIKGRLTVRISSYNAYHITLNLNSEGEIIKSS